MNIEREERTQINLQNKGGREGGRKRGREGGREGGRDKGVETRIILVGST